MTSILIIDDNINDLFTLQAVFENKLSNCSILTAEGPKMGIQIAQTTEIDVILLDIIMPLINGYEVCRLLKADNKTSGIPIIIISSGLRDTKSRIKAFEAGAESIIQKPIIISELIAQTKAMIRIKKNRDSLLEKENKLEMIIDNQAREILNTREDYKNLLDNIGEGIVTLDAKNNFLYINNTGASILGYHKAELLGENLRKVMSEEMLNKVLEENIKADYGHPAKFNINIRSKSGEDKVLLLTSMPDYNSKKEYIGSSGVFRDVTKNVQDEYLLKMQFELSKISAATNDLGLISRSFLQFAIKSKDIDCASIYIHNSKSNTMLLTDTIGLENASINYSKVIEFKQSQLDEIIKGNAFYGNANDLNSEYLNKKNIKAIGIIPIINNEKLIAEVNISSTSCNSICHETKLTLEYLTNLFHSVIRRLEAEKENNKNIARYKSLVQGTRDAILTIEKGIITDCNQSLVDLLLYESKDDLINKSPLDFSPDKLIGNINPLKEGIQAIKKTVKDGFNEFEWILQKANGEMFWVEARLSLVKVGNKRMISGILRDLTQQKNQDNEIKKFKTITDKASYGCSMIDLEGNIFYCNTTYANMLGFTDEEIIGKNLFSLHTKEQTKTINNLINRLYEIGSFAAEEVWQTTKDGKSIPTLMNAVLMKDENGDPHYISTTASDITNIKNYEQQLKDTLEKANESDKLKDAFLATISHELRTPLNAVIGFSQIMEGELKAEEINIYANLIYESGIHLKDIVEDIFYFTLVKSGNVKLNPTNNILNVVFSQTQSFCDELQKSMKKEEVILSIIATKKIRDLKLTTDFEKLHQILKLLINNAFKFTFTGKIDIGCNINNDDEILFFVKDTGIGIPDDKKEIIFEFFRQSDESLSRQFEGTGIGLAIAHKLVEMLGGKIWVESNLGEGSEFYFTLPLK